MMRVQALVTDEQYAKLNALADEHKVEVSHVLQLLVANALAGPTKRPVKRMTADRLILAARLVNLGHTQEFIAQQLGVSRPTIGNHYVRITRKARELAEAGS